MQYLIDGHNLIPKIPGISLSDPEDEMRLIETLQPWARAKRASVTVFFDRAATGQSKSKSFGVIRAIFIPQGKIADTAIMEALSSLGKKARNFAVVSSDRMVQAAARSVHAQVISSDSFAQSLRENMPPNQEDSQTFTMSESELMEWQELFSARNKKIQ